MCQLGGGVIAWRADGSGLPPTSRVMPGRAVRGTEATRTFCG